MSWTDGTYTECISYLEDALVPKLRKATIQRVVRHLRKRIDEFDAIAVCGVSGLLIGTTVADKLDKPLIVVRKPDDKTTHSRLKVEGSLLGRYLIVDDLVCFGGTVRRMVKAIKEHNEYAVCVGVYCFAEMYYPTYYEGDPCRSIGVAAHDGGSATSELDIVARFWYNAKATKKHPQGRWL
jgi:hypothetical protein